MPGQANAACLSVGTILTCTGDVAGGVAATDPIELVQINNLTSDITPADGVNGVDFTSAGTITIVGDTGAFQIVATNADGIYANTWNGSVTVDHDGNIVSNGGYGIRTVSLGGTSVTGTGNINATLGGIVIRNDDAGPTTFLSRTGNIVVTAGAGISVVTSSTPLIIVNEGTIDASGDGISAVNTSTSGNVSVSQDGNIIAGGRGIYADAAFGSVSLTSSGDITAVGDGIQLLSSGSDVIADHTGNVTSTGGRGIFLDSPNGTVTLTGSGTIQANGDGIFAQSTGVGDSSSVTWTGNVTSDAGKGVYAYSANGPVTILTDGNVASHGDALFAMNTSTSPVSVTHTGNLTSADGNGVYAYTSGGQVSVSVSDSIINADGYGIFAQTKSADSATVGFNGTIASSWVGIQAESTNGAVSVTSTGEIAASAHGIWAANTGSQGVTVNQTGGIDAGTGHAIYAYTPQGSVSVTASGELFESGMTAIYAENKGSSSVTVGVTGDIDSGDGGITAKSAQGEVSVTMRGDIDANADGIYAENKGASQVRIDSIGDVDAGGSALFASSSQGLIDVDSVGNLTAGGYGIYAVNQGSNSVTVNSTGIIDSTNRGIYAQSATGTVTVVSSGNVTSDSDAIFAQSAGASPVSVTSVGDLTAGASGDGIYVFAATGAVTVNSTGEIDAGSDGIFARSTGANTVSVTSVGDISADSGYGIYGYAATGAVTIQSNGGIWSNDHGIYALNLGYNAVGVAQVGDINSNATGIRATSTGGAVSVDNEGDIDAGTDGIYASTLGNALVSIVNVGDIDAGGYGIFGFSSAGAVTIGNTGNIVSTGDGISAQTLGIQNVSVTQNGDIDAGGYGIFANSMAGNTTVNTIGDITAVNHGIYALTNGDTLIDIDHEGDITSTTGHGIVATSIARGTIDVSVDGGAVSGALDGIRATSWGAMTVTVGEDATVTGGAGNAGVRFVEGLGIQLNNYGTIANAGGINEWAIVSAQNDTTVDNYGTISGNVLLGPWNNPFNNHSGALFNMGGTVNIAQDSTLTNSGTLSPGGSGNLQTTALTGILVNDATGTMLFDIDMDNSKSDRIDVSNSASLDGDLRLNFISANGTPDTYTIVTTTNGVTTQSLTLLNPFVVGDINYVNGGNDVELSIDGFDFAPVGMGPNATSIGNAINGSLNGPGSLGPIAVALLNLPMVEDGENALNQLSPNIYVGEQIASVENIDTFTDSMLSCRMAGDNAFAAEGECAWARGVYSTYDRSAPPGDLTGFESRSAEFMGGVQMAIDGTDWRVGGSIGYRASDRNGDGGSSSKGGSFSAGAVAKYAPGQFLFAAAVSASRGSYDTMRVVDFGGFTDLLSGETDVTTVTGRLRAAYTMQSGAFYVRPMVDVAATYVRTGAFTETGGIASVSTSGVTNTVLAAMPAVEIGGQIQAGEDLLIRPYLRGGVNFYSGNNYSLTGVFTADGNAATPFTIGTSSEDVLWTVSTGVDVLKGNLGTLQIFYEGAFGKNTAINAGGAKFSVNF